ncbi:M23 family metallopeptidase [Euzebya rosea]|uniref:M23 family metallopeptidase n=1 Tax=Euzebya rosea TaxID=2052804 RepID=UPI000D3E0D8D|nr:M23 family metallopeptidase [Euzebya rosea]
MTAIRRAAATVALALTLVGATTVDETADAEAELGAAERRLAAVQTRLDRLAETYESLAAHATRLADEVGRTDAAVQDAQERHAEAEEAVRAAVRRRSMTPPLAQLWVFQAWRRASDASSALHLTALADRLPDLLADRAARAESTSTLLADERRQHELITAGTATSQDDLELARAGLDEQLEIALREVDGAREIVQAAQEREAEAADLEAAATQVSGGAGWTPPPVMACPLGLPNGFSPSWGAPRSGGRSHQGVDMFAARGMPVLAAAAGTVRVGSNGLGGLTVNLYDTAGNRYYYAHLDSVAVTSGQTVAAGQTVGGAGTSGNARGTPPHLHWQVHPGGRGPTDPYPIAAALCRP